MEAVLEIDETGTEPASGISPNGAAEAMPAMPTSRSTAIEAVAITLS
jgi:hypothetical protein